MSNIVLLKSNNVLRLDAVEITPKGNTVIIGGDNGQGKTSVLDSITLAIGGKAAKHQMPLKQGEKKGNVVVVLDDLIVKRTFTEKGSNLVVTNRDGAKFQSPQSILDKLTGELTFDPLAWSNMDSQKQLSILKKMVGLDFTEKDNERKKLYDERTQINNEGKRLKAQYDSLPDFKDVPENEIQINDLVSELDEAQKKNREREITQGQIEHLEQNLSGKKESINIANANIENAEKKIQELQDFIKKTDLAVKQFDVDCSDIQKSIEELEQKIKDSEIIDTDPIKEKMSSAESINRKVRAKKEKEDLYKSIQEKKYFSLAKTEKIEEIVASKEKVLSDASFPVPGLSFNADGVLYNGIPFNQASSAEQLRVSVGMGIAMNPKLKILLIRDGSLLDEKNLQAVSDMATEAGAQIWIERVGKGEECQVIIQDGKVLN